MDPDALVMFESQTNHNQFANFAQTTPPLLKTTPPSFSQQEQPLDSIVSDHVVWIVEVVVITILCGIISAAGLVANVINAIVFIRQGALSSSSNVSLLSLAFADIGCLIPVFCNSVNYALVLLGHSDLFMTAGDFMEIAVIWPHIMFMQIASWITAYIALERCICVMLPLKVKSLFSAKRSLVITSSIAMIITMSFIPTFVTQRVADIHDPVTNTTKLVFMPTDYHAEVTENSDVIHAIILRPLALAIVFVCTQITIYRVKLSTTWRKSIVTVSSTATPRIPPPSSNATTSTDKAGGAPDSLGNADMESRGEYTKDDNTNTGYNIPKLKKNNTDSKETRLIKMITIINSIFMVCNAPDIFGVFVLLSLQSALQLSLADNLFRLIVATQLCLESVNSAINILVYYVMSTAYKKNFRALCGRM